MEAEIKEEKKEKLIVAIDIETSGPSLMKNDMTTIGAVAVRYPSGKEVSSFVAHIRPITGTIRYDERTLREFWQKNPAAWEKMLNGIRDHGESANDAMQRFVNWVRGLGEIPLIVYDTAGFDCGFVNRYLEFTDVSSMDYISGDYVSCFDTTSYHRGVARRTWTDSPWGNDDAAGKAVGLFAIEAECPYYNSHDPLEDARKIAWVTCKISEEIEKTSIKIKSQ